MREHVVYIGLGANLDNPQQTIQAAMIELGKIRSSRLTHSSSLYLTAPVDADGDDYVNAVVELHTHLNPAELHDELKRIEQQFGRTRIYKNAPRTLDLDLLLYDQLSLETSTLNVPHPRMTQRAFVMVPLLEIAPTIHIPGVGPLQPLLANVQHQVISKKSITLPAFNDTHHGKTPWPVI